jgi:transposase
MIAVRADLKVLVASRPVDFRKGIHSLVALVAEALMADPYCGDIFVFRSKRADRIKLIAWDGSGMVLMTKWLEEGRFAFPAIQDGAVRLTATELSVLLAGLDWTKVRSRAVKRPSKAV